MANLKASISFGLVNIPVEIVTAEDPKEEVSFHLIDSRDNSRVRYKRVNENTGKEVEWEDIVKGVEVSKDEYVTFSADELQELITERNKGIQIESVIRKEEISPALYETPYYLVPGKGGEKAYALLQRALAKSDRYAVVQAVLRNNKEHLGVLMPEHNALVLGLLRYPEELKKIDDIVPASLDKVKVTEKELAMADRLLKDLAGKFKPAQYKDSFAENVDEAVKQKMKGTKKRSPRRAEKAASGKGVDIMDLLSKSLKERERAPRAKKRRA